MAAKAPAVNATKGKLAFGFRVAGKTIAIFLAGIAGQGGRYFPSAETSS